LGGWWVGGWLMRWWQGGWLVVVAFELGSSPASFSEFYFYVNLCLFWLFSAHNVVLRIFSEISQH
jgi:hypothetical protein